MFADWIRAQCKLPYYLWKRHKGVPFHETFSGAYTKWTSEQMCSIPKLLLANSVISLFMYTVLYSKEYPLHLKNQVK